jgi:hypothetical protein
MIGKVTFINKMFVSIVRSFQILKGAFILRAYISENLKMQSAYIILVKKKMKKNARKFIYEGGKKV